MEVSSSRKNPESVPYSSSTSPWCDLPDDLAILIFELLSLLDYICFACVCQKWRSIQKFHRRLHFPNPPPMLKPFPWVISNPYRPYQNKLKFYSHFDSKISHIDLPKAARGNESISSSKGWIFLIDVCKHVCLLNPLTNFLIKLPPIDTTLRKFSGELSASPLDPNCIALIVERTTDLAYLYRVGQKQPTWTTVSFPNYQRHHYDLASVHRGVFYCHDKFYCVEGSLSVIDPSSNNPSRRALKINNSEMAAVRRQSHYLTHYLMEFRGELIDVAAMILSDGRREFQVFRVDFSRNKWIRMNDVVDLVFFISMNGSVCLSASYVGCKGNCVYYHDGRSEHKAYRVFDMDSKQWSDGLPLPLEYNKWFLPSLDVLAHT